MRNKTSTIKET